MKKLIEDNPYRPNIYSIGVGLELGLLWCYVLLRSSHGLHNDVFRAQPKIRDLEIGYGLPLPILLGEQDVLWFQVPMGDAVVVQLLHALRDLKNTIQRLQLTEFVVLDFVESIPESQQQLPQRPTGAVLRQVPNILVRLDDLKDLQNIIAADLLQLFIDLLLLQYVGHVTFGLHYLADGDVPFQLIVVNLIDLPLDVNTFAKLPYPMS